MMDRKLNMFGTSIDIPPESMQVWNTIFILMMIPIVEKVSPW